VVAKKWNLRLVAPTKAVRLALGKGWSATLQDLQGWMDTELVRAMVHGGLGIEGIAQTPFYKFVSSAEGLSQLGIEKTEPPKLLTAYERTIKIKRSKNTVNIRFGDLALLKLATPHPAAGTGNLQIQSWLEWIVDGKRVESGFVPKSRLPKRLHQNIRIKSAPGGLMLPQGSFSSVGLWRFPPQFLDFERKWLAANIRKIEKLVQDQTVVFLNRRLK